MVVNTKDIDQIVETYSDLKNLKLVGNKLNIPWQTVYWHLKKRNVDVTGDKQRYGSSSDKLASVGEGYFSKIVPSAVDKNKEVFQSSYDFYLKGIKIDVKTSTLKEYKSSKNKNITYKQWKFSIKLHQHESCDYLVFIALDEDKITPAHWFLVPVDLIGNMQCVTIPCHLKSKWSDFLITEKGIKEFFEKF